MNYKPVVGWWFYGGTTATQTANFFGSWGLLGDAPDSGGAGLYHYSIPYHPIHPIHPNFARMGTGILMLWIWLCKILEELK